MGDVYFTCSRLLSSGVPGIGSVQDLVTFRTQVHVTRGLTFNVQRLLLTENSTSSMAPLGKAINIQSVPFDPSILPSLKDTWENSKLYAGAVDPDWLIGR